MADEKGYTIPIYITPGERGNGAGSGEDYLPMQTDGVGGEGQESQLQVVGKAKSGGNAAKAIISQIAGKVLSTALNNYGNITGDYATQQNIQIAITEASKIASAVALGPVGVAMYGVEKIFNYYNYVSQLKRSKTQAEFKQQRVYAESIKS